MFACIFSCPAPQPRWPSPGSIKAPAGDCVSPRHRLAASLCAGVIALATTGAALAAENLYPLEVLPPEYRRMTDPQTGAELLFLTTAPENNANLYFHDTPGWQTNR